MSAWGTDRAQPNVRLVTDLPARARRSRLLGFAAGASAGHASAQDSTECPVPAHGTAIRASHLVAGAAGVLLVACGAAWALDAAPRPQPLAPVTTYGSAREALRDGMRDYNAGDKAGAAQALEYAATQGHTLALWKLGRMYADGDGVRHDDLKAFEYFSKLADENADESPDSPNASVVASAFVSLGSYFLTGI